MSIDNENCDPVMEEVRRTLTSIVQIYEELDSNAGERCLICRLRADAGAFMGMVEIIARNPGLFHGDHQGDAAGEYITTVS